MATCFQTRTTTNEKNTSALRETCEGALLENVRGHHGVEQAAAAARAAARARRSGKARDGHFEDVRVTLQEGRQAARVRCRRCVHREVHGHVHTAYIHDAREDEPSRGQSARESAVALRTAKDMPARKARFGELRVAVRGGGSRARSGRAGQKMVRAVHSGLTRPCLFFQFTGSSVAGSGGGARGSGELKDDCQSRSKSAPSARANARSAQLKLTKACRA